MPTYHEEAASMYPELVESHYGAGEVERLSYHYLRRLGKQIEMMLELAADHEAIHHDDEPMSEADTIKALCDNLLDDMAEDDPASPAHAMTYHAFARFVAFLHEGEAIEDEA